MRGMPDGIRENLRSVAVASVLFVALIASFAASVAGSIAIAAAIFGGM